MEEYLIKFGPNIVGILTVNADCVAVYQGWREFYETRGLVHSLNGFAKWLIERGYTADVKEAPSVLELL